MILFSEGVLPSFSINGHRQTDTQMNIRTYERG